MKSASQLSNKHEPNAMKKTTLGRLEALEDEERSVKVEQESLFATTFFFYWKVVIAHYVGGLKLEEEDPGEAEARALNYPSRYDYLSGLCKEEIPDISTRLENAARLLFAQVGLDLDRTPARCFVCIVCWHAQPAPGAVVGLAKVQTAGRLSQRSIR
jgi:hypothetical protein